MKIEGKRTTTGAQRSVVFCHGAEMSVQNESQSGNHWEEIVTGSGFILVRDISNTGKHYCYMACVIDGEEVYKRTCPESRNFSWIHYVCGHSYNCFCELENSFLSGRYDIQKFFPPALAKDAEYVRTMRDKILLHFPMAGLSTGPSPIPLHFSDFLDEFDRDDLMELGNHENFLRVINSLIKEGIFEVGIRKDAWVLKRVR